MPSTNILRWNILVLDTVKNPLDCERLHNKKIRSDTDSAETCRGVQLAEHPPDKDPFGLETQFHGGALG